MQGKLFLFCLWSFVSFSSNRVIDYKLHVTKKQSDTMQVCLNDRKSKCVCGNDPKMVLILEGRPFVYCEEHAPEVVRVKRITLENLNKVLNRK